MSIRAWVWRVTREEDFEVTIVTFGNRDDCVDTIHGTDIRFEIEDRDYEDLGDGECRWYCDEDRYELRLEAEVYDLDPAPPQSSTA